SVLIEADTTRFRDLQRNYASRTNVITLDRIVGYGESDGLDSILAPLPVPRDFDLLSIDIDGNDYHVWKATSVYQPKVVIIEFNPTIPTDIRFVQVADGTVTQGASLLALVELGKEKGYELVSVLHFNAVFVKKEFFAAFEIESNAPAVLRTDLSSVTYLFSGYDGKIFLRGARRLPWHGIELDESDVQPLPRFLRRHPGLYSLPQKVAFALRHPGRLLEWLRAEGKRLRK
ncbi:MAG: FkbM family methyltransferase, partial [Polyangiaceae bacterium]